MAQSDSVMFSLQELARMEERRVREHAAAAQRDIEARACAEREALERARKKAEERERAEVEAQRDAQRRAREDQARIDALERAAIEAARVTVDARARAEERERERRHELEVEYARGTARRRTSRSAGLGALLGVILGAGGATTVSLAALGSRGRMQREQANTEIASRDEAIRDLRAGVDATRARLQTLEESLATTRAARDHIQADLDDARRRLARPTPGRRSTSGAEMHGADTKFDGLTTCPPGSKDPLCLR
jgi:membrane protein involved in colicin uptake